MNPKPFSGNIFLILPAGISILQTVDGNEKLRPSDYSSFFLRRRPGQYIA
jgi:hypothetical protein